MPNYDYRCEGCGHAFDELQTMSAKPLKKCPKCKKRKLVRLIGTGIFMTAGANPYEGVRAEHIRLGTTSKKKNRC